MPGMVLELEVSLEMTSPILGPWQREPNTEEARALTGAPVGAFGLPDGVTQKAYVHGPMSRGDCVEGKNVSPVKGRLKEAIGAHLFRTQVKRRKASATGKSTLSDEALYLPVLLAYWRRDRCEIQVSYPGRSVGFRRMPVGLRTQGQWLMTHQTGVPAAIS